MQAQPGRAAVAPPRPKVTLTSPAVVNAPRLTFEDPRVPHQIVLNFTTRTCQIILSCTCLARSRHRIPIETRAVFPAADAIAAWTAWHLEAVS